jgi:hypothetical protein
MSLFTSAFATLARRLLTGGSSHLLDAAQTFLRRTVQHLVDEAEERLREKVVAYIAVAVLALVAALSLAFAVAQGLTALGVPLWASHLIVAATAGVAAWVAYGRVLPRQVVESDAEPAAARELTIKIVNEVRTPKPRRKKKRRVKAKVRRLKKTRIRAA